MKTCIQCGETKDESEFYKIKAQPDGKDYYCKPCRSEYNRAHQGKNKMPQSTVDVRDALLERGIPVTPGYNVGMPWYDLVAYGYIPIEAKSSRPQKYNRAGNEIFNFKFTSAQVEKYSESPEGFVVFVANGRKRSFLVVPARMLAVRKNVLITYPTSEVCSFEGAFNLIEDKVIDDIKSRR